MRRYTNLTVMQKLLITALVCAVVSVVIAASGFVGLSQLKRADLTLYTASMSPIESIATMFDELANQRITLSNAAIHREHNPAFAAEELAALTDEKEPNFVAAMEAYHDFTSGNPDAERVYQELKAFYNGDFATAKQAVQAALKSGDDVAIADAMEAMDSVASEMSDYVSAAMAENSQHASEVVAANGSMFNVTVLFLAVMMLLGVAVVLALSLYSARTIQRPVQLIADTLDEMSAKGTLQFPSGTTADLERYARQPNQIGNACAALLHTMTRLSGVGALMSSIAAGNFNVRNQVLSDTDVMGKSVSTMIAKLNRLFADFGDGIAAFDNGAAELSNDSLELAQGTVQQTSTVEALSASIHEIAAQTHENAQFAASAASLSNSIRGNAEKGAAQMSEMARTVNEINDAAAKMSQVIKVIDDIAFQTNILALNAAVEAARAGSAGKGFAVVAEEVRSLAAKSAEAANDTGAIIDDTVAKAASGATIAAATAASLGEIVSGINESSTVMSKIAERSEAQNAAIAHINRSIDQVAQIVQRTAAIAQNSAAAASTLTDEADELNAQLSRFELLDGYAREAAMVKRKPVLPAVKECF